MFVDLTFSLKSTNLYTQFTHTLTHTHTAQTHTCKHRQSRTMIFNSLNKDVHVRHTTGNCGHFVCTIADTQLVYDFWALNRGPNPVHIIFFFFFNIPLYARVGNLQPFACIHKSWTILVCNVVFGLMVECRSMPSVESAYKDTHTLTNTHTHTHRHVLDLPNMVKSISMWKRESVFCNTRVKIPCVYVYLTAMPHSQKEDFLYNSPIPHYAIKLALMLISKIKEFLVDKMSFGGRHTHTKSLCSILYKKEILTSVGTETRNLKQRHPISSYFI